MHCAYWWKAYKSNKRNWYFRSCNRAVVKGSKYCKQHQESANRPVFKKD